MCKASEDGQAHRFEEVLGEQRRVADNHLMLASSESAPQLPNTVLHQREFLDLSDLNSTEEEQLTSLLYSYTEAVELPYSWNEQPDPYLVVSPEPVNGGEQMAGVDPQVDYATGTPMMAVPTIAFTQMMATPNVYVSNVTANVNVHGFMTPTVPYAPVPFQPVDPQRKPRNPKTPNKRSPDTRRAPDAPQTNYTHAQPQFQQTFPAMAYNPYNPYQQFYQPIPRPMVPVASMYSPTYPGYPTPVFTPPPGMSVQQPSVEHRDDNPVPYEEEEEEKMELPPEYNQEICEEEEPQPVVETVIVENRTLLQPDVEEFMPQEPPPVEEVKVEKEKPLVTKAPPATAFKSASSLTQKPPFPTQNKPKRPSLDNGPQFVDPPLETGPPRKSYAQMASNPNDTLVKPLAMIHPTVHPSNVNSVAPRVQNTGDKPNEQVQYGTPNPQQENMPNESFPTNLKPRMEKMILQDYDINLQRLGEFLNSYQLDHRPALLQPRGLTNRSNYCYINAILQALIACPAFYNLMKAIPPSQENKSGKSRTPIIDSMVKFVNEFSQMSLRVGRKEKAQATKDGNAASEVVAGPTFEPTYVYKMLSAMPAAFPVEGRQEDAEEFLSCLLNGLNDEMLEALKLIEPQSNGLSNGVTANGDSAATNGDHSDQDQEWTEVVNKSNKSVVTRRADFGRTPLSAIFRGQMRSRVFRANIENGTTDNVQPFFTLQLDIEKANSVDKALELLMGKDEVFGGVCPKTNQEISMYTQTSLEELPIILMLHLKCFDYKLHTCSKIIKTVEFPVCLKIDPKHLTCKNKTNIKDRNYKLLAVVYHDGKEATKGHYMTDVYHQGYAGWVRYDDAIVRPVSEAQVLNPKGPRVPYLLYYRRCDTISQQDNTNKNR